MMFVTTLQCNVAVTSLAKSAVNEKIAKKNSQSYLYKQRDTKPIQEVKSVGMVCNLVRHLDFQFENKKKTNSWFQYFV